MSTNLIQPFTSIYPTPKYQDRSLFIQEVLETQTDVLAITRPPQHGKTVVLAMLQSFLKKLFSFQNDDFPSDSLFSSNGRAVLN